jgi:predicted fused transcriptional regulator/phosphomethylpyrimidine kinase/predicted transcriptional regulator
MTYVMHPPCELMVDTFLPSMRALVARRLNTDGLSQGRIASLLGLTQASVSFYLSTSSAKHTTALSSLGVTAEEAETYAGLLAEDLKNNPTYAVATLYSIWSRLIGGGDACARHRSEYPFLATCDVCIKVFGHQKGHAEGAVEHVESALRSIEGSPLFVHIMPQISVNVAYAPQGAKSIEAVVAIPGRIVRVRGQARSFMRPEYGASTHLAAILLEVDRKHPALRAAMNLRYDDRMAKVLSKLRFEHLTMGSDYPSGSQDKVLGALRALLSTPDGARDFEAIVDLGGVGVEPSLYLFAVNAIKVVRRALEIARAYTSSG